jgi:hypothetical protein
LRLSAFVAETHSGLETGVALAKAKGKETNKRERTQHALGKTYMDASDGLFLGLFGRLLLYWLRLINEVSDEKNTKSKKKKKQKTPSPS